MIANGENQWHYLAVKRLPASLRGITSKRHGDLYCLKVPQSFVTEKSLNCTKKYVKRKIFVTLSCLLKILKY